MTSRQDPWVNMLRGTVAAFAAGVGGADAVTVVPFDEPLGLPDAFGRRIARNTSSLLIEESHVATVTDPAGGSYAVEKLTDDLAVAGVGRARPHRGRRRRSRERPPAGVKERVEGGPRRRATRRSPTGHARSPASRSSLTSARRCPSASTCRTATSTTTAGPTRTCGPSPPHAPVFLATMGPIAAHTARATFATNLLAAGGVAVEAVGATDGVEAVTAAYAGQPVVCLAGTDAAYAEWGADLVAALRAAGASYVVLAGKPGERTVTDVDDSCAMGVDALGFLGRIREELAR